jgi:hypothetical protein
VSRPRQRSRAAWVLSSVLVLTAAVSTGAAGYAAAPPVAPAVPDADHDAAHHAGHQAGPAPAVPGETRPAVLAATAASAAAEAVPGTVLRTIGEPGDRCRAPGGGVAFDGTSLLTSCEGGAVIEALSPADGSVVTTYRISGADSFGALAWDRTRGLLWACHGGAGTDTVVYQIDLAARTATPKVTGVPGCRTGLAYDGADDTLWLGPDDGPTLYHYSVAGERLGAFALNLGSREPEGPCDNAGIAVGGGDVFLSNDGCSQLYRTHRTDPAAVELVANTDQVQLGDLECDDVTFAGHGQAAIWSRNPSGGALTAFELDAGGCGYGGLPPVGLGGPVVLTGIDAEDSPPGSHGQPAVYEGLINSILDNTFNQGDGILVIGAHGTTPEKFWTGISGLTHQAVTFGTADSALTGFRMVAVVGSSPETLGGLSEDDNNTLTRRQADFANFVNGGGGLLGNTQSDFANEYAYVSGFARISSQRSSFGECKTRTDVAGYCDITPTPEGLKVGIEDETLDLCCWHNVFTDYPPFLRPLAFEAGSTTRAAVIGARHASIPVAIRLDPPSADNPARTEHTVTATIQDARRVPAAGLPVTFTVTEGPNAGERSDPGECAADADCTTDVAGQVSWTYRSNGDIGRDVIQACFHNPTTDEPACVTATKNWTRGDPVAELTPLTLDFQDQTPGQTSGPLPLQIRNAGTGRLDLGALTASGPAADEVSIEPCDLTVLFGGEECTAHVRITPATAGPRTAAITLAATPPTPVPPPVTVLANGAAGALVAEPSPLDAGTQAVGTVGPGHQLALNNTGTVPLRLTSVAISGADAGFFGLTAAGTSCPGADGQLAAGAHCVLGVSFHPDRRGVHVAALQVQAAPVLRPNPPPDQPPVTAPVSLAVALAGIGAPAVLTAGPSPVRLATAPLGRDGPRITVVVHNPGPGPARLGAVSLTGRDPGQFRFAGTACAARLLPANATCVLPVWAHPDRVSQFGASLVLTSRDLAAPLVIPVSGTAARPTLQVTPRVGQVGQVLLARGAGFPPGSTVDLRWLSGITAGHRPVVVRPDGTFVSQVLIVRKDKLGVRVMQASGPGYQPLQVRCLVVRRALPSALGG